MTADATSFAPGVSATFTVSITNTGEDACLVDAGEAQREIVITSGTDRIWSNRDCIEPGTETRTLLLPAGGTTRRRSSGTGSGPRRAARLTCPSPAPAPTPRS